MLANDLFSYAKEKLSNSDGKNIMRILQEKDGLNLDYTQAVDRVKIMLREKEQEYISAGTACLEDHELGKDPDVRRWIASLPYVMTGNVIWSQQEAPALEACREVESTSSALSDSVSKPSTAAPKCPLHRV
ncbi:hypothetical protein PHLCEN_2v9590 [Hermanssonia centrifuga]|uniref:Uncharacterized protein n=1 Tax=Hermanssonia centrifuga TaxID=98765 RepID=A0A2R6NQ74_9APHY|nr:hypothetical protein PHLCEN_2v9590 [Hermanssonia centrifuga]